MNVLAQILWTGINCVVRWARIPLIPSGIMDLLAVAHRAKSCISIVAPKYRWIKRMKNPL